MAAISFKSVGEKTEDVSQRTSSRVESIPIGIMTPVREGDDTDGIFKMHRDVVNQIHDNLKNLLLTNKGDRVIQYDMGADLQRLAMEYRGQEDFDIAAMLNIKRAVGKYMPFVTLNDFESSIIKDDIDNTTQRVLIRIRYSIDSINVRNKAIDASFFLGG